MTTQVDARGLSCPQPVILARDAIQVGDFPVEVLVETVTSRENVKRAAEKLGCAVQIEEVGRALGDGAQRGRHQGPRGTSGSAVDRRPAGDQRRDRVRVARC